jgi:LacI family transcriptional regulator
VAILSAEHDSVFAALSALPLSSLDMVPFRIGREAAALLHRQLEGKPAPEKPVLIPPAGVIQRQSSETAAVADPPLARALHFIRDHAGEPIRVADLVRVSTLSRRTLEHRFHRTLGRSPAREIRRVKLERVKRLLIETDWPMPEIAARTGFNHHEVMIRSFAREFGSPPGRFRRFR